jgi:aminoglycoside phosphotransferase (APT) family kinase protein
LSVGQNVAVSPVLPYGARLPWEALPAFVRGWVEESLGSGVVSAVTQPGGFSPGVAARLVTTSGERAFVKAVGPEPNREAVSLHRREATVLAALPEGLPVPRLLAVLDEQGWVALLQEDVDGRPPHHPWTLEDAVASLAALAALGAATAPGSWPDLSEELAGAFTGWSRLAAEPPDDLDPWAASRLAELDGLSRATLPRLAGTAVVHADSRSDNLLVQPDGTVRVVDWAWASRGSAWFDAVSLLVNVRLYGDLDVAPLLPLIHDLGATDEDVLGVIAGLGGFMAEVSRRPDVPGLPTLRAFQRAQELAVYRLLRELT